MKKSSIFLLLFTVVSLVLIWGETQLSHAGQLAQPGEATECLNGLAGAYPCRNVNLLAHLPNSEMGTAETLRAANLWGWTDPESGKEYVLIGLEDGMAFIDVSDPVNPLFLGKLPSHDYPVTTSFRDVKVYENYAFIVGDQPSAPSAQGLQLFDLTALRGVTTPVTFTETLHDGSFTNGHNIFIHEATGYAYIVRNLDACPGALVFNVQQPLTPTYTGCYENDGAASDTVCVLYHGPDADYQGHEICAFSSDDRLVVGDLTTKSLTMTSHLSNLNYPNAARAHHAWFTEDHHYLISVDMDDEHHQGTDTHIFFWDMSDLDIPERTPAFIYTGPTEGSDHNVWVRDGFAYIGNLRAGLRILDVRDIGDVQEAAFFDTFPSSDVPGHEQGAWAVYPYFESGVVAVSNREGGLFLLAPQLPGAVYMPFIVNR
jgi:choice-of-anchor B domain-containing protein